MSNSNFKFDERLDTDFLNSIYDGDLEHAAVVFSQYLKQTPAHLIVLENVYKQGVLENFRQLVHKVKPVFSYVGLTHITHQAGVLEKMCGQVTSMAALNVLYTEFKKAIYEFTPIIEEQLKQLKQLKQQTL